MNSTIGIDVSKDRFDVFCLAGHEHRQFTNNSNGLDAFHSWITGKDILLIVFEASGIYHRELEANLVATAVPYLKVNPCQARRFAEATGRIAKTDKVDAEVLARMGAVLRLQPPDPQGRISERSE